MKAVINAADSRDEAEGPLLPEEDAPSDMASFQPPDSDLPSFLEDCNRVAKPFLFYKAAEQESKELLSYNLFDYTSAVLQGAFHSPQYFLLLLPPGQTTSWYPPGSASFEEHR